VLCTNRTQTSPLIGALVVAVALSAFGSARPQQNQQRDVESVVREFLTAFSNRDRFGRTMRS
jgi:hypothetical protein